MNVLEVANLRVTDDRNDQVIIKDLSFSLEEHRCLALVGESGSGKSMTVKAISGIHKPWIQCGGEIVFEGRNLLAQPAAAIRDIRGKKIFMIFQDGMSAFDPSCPILNTLREIMIENLGGNKETADPLIYASMEKVLLKNPGELLGKYPHQLSGGMLQRIMIALSLALEPRIIIADEPTTSLDTITQYEVINELIRVKETLKTAMIFISHDLGIVRKLADYMIVMKEGTKVEEGSVEEVINHPREDYTKYLVNTRKALSENYHRLRLSKGYESC